jgi:hypothetical protein
MPNIYNNIKKNELSDNLKQSIISKKYNKKFYDFCYNYQYNNNKNLLDIYYNLYLVIKKCRFSFFIAHTDYPTLKIVIDIIKEIKKYTYKYNICILKKNINSNNVYFILLNKNKNKFIEKYIEDESIIGELLSYPYYDHSWNNKFIDFMVSDENGIYQLFANWYDPKIDNKIKFIELTSKWIDILEKLNLDIVLNFTSNFYEY